MTLIYPWRCARCDSSEVKLVTKVEAEYALREATETSLTFDRKPLRHVVSQWVHCTDCGSRWRVPEDCEVRFVRPGDDDGESS